uniref:Ribosomal RNA adenine methylase transferase N-terminal domain-containing protein n=1 Tax=candidate division WOR-3 bacterium TaxID=2052148 RepID=A0A7C3J7F5_UNCW3
MSSSGKRVKLSQNFLTDRNVLKNIEISLPELEGKNVLEIGGGDGKISEIILSKKPDNLSILELDRVYFEILKEKFSKFENVKIFNKSCLDYKIEEDITVSSIPYSLSKDIFKKIVESESIEEGYFIVQKEFGEKITKGSFLPISMYVNIFFETENIFDIKKNSFNPPPKVDSRLLHILRKKSFEKKYDKLWDFLNFLTQNRNRNLNKFFKDLDERKIHTLSLEEILKIYADKYIHSY